MTDWTILERLEDTIASRRDADPDTSYAAKLFSRGTKKVAQKVGEEAVELALAAVMHDREEIAKETADLLFHVTVLLQDADMTLADVLAVLEAREGTSGLVEKASRNTA